MTQDQRLDDYQCEKHAETMGNWGGTVRKLNASPAGGARIINIVNPHWNTYGPRGVAKGRVEDQNFGHGNTPCLYNLDFVSNAEEFQ